MDHAVEAGWGRRLPRAARAWLLIAVMAALAAAVTLLLPSRPAFGSVLTVRWWWLAPAFALAYTLLLHIEFRQQAPSLAMDQIPLVIGLFYAAPAGVVLAVSVGAFASGLWRREALVKNIFNTTNHALATATAVVIFEVIRGSSDRPSVGAWLATLVGVLIAAVLSTLSVMSVIALVDQRPSLGTVANFVGLEALVSVVTSPLAVVSALGIGYDDSAAFLLAACLAVGWLGYRGLNGVMARHQALTRLYTFARDIGPMVPDDGDLRPTLTEARDLLHADKLEFALLEGDSSTVFSVSHELEGLEIRFAEPGQLPAPALQVLSSDKPALLEGRQTKRWARQRKGDDRMVARVGPAARPLGVLVAEHRSGPVRGFETGDLRLLEVVAGQLGTALEKGELLEGLRRAATTDPLTGLPNLNALRAHLDERLANVPSAGGLVVLFVDIDRFQDINDTLGHDAGDSLLAEVAQRLARAAHEQGFCGRVGGDKFAVVLPGAASSEISRLAAMAVKNRVEGPVPLERVSADLRVTIGMARAPDHGTDAATLLRRAEMAASAGKGTSTGIAEWQPEHEQAGARRLELLSALRRALAAGLVDVAFQPKLRLGSGQVAGLEALARWSDPELGTVSPTEFIPLAETSGLIGSLTTAVLRAALQACRGWHERGIQVGVSVNLSARSLNDPIIVGQVAAILAATGVDPSWLTLEITESSVMENPTQTIAILDELHALGCRLSIDDFGTGYSSLTYVRGLPVNELKIDKAFVDNVANDPTDRAVIHAVVELAHSLGLATVAEGVESPEQALTLEGLHIDEVQGYFYARPMSAEDTAEWLALRAAQR